jgi:chemotaxis protein CheD
MRAPSDYFEYFLQPGEFQFSEDPDVRMRTLLGSCVAMTMWHPKRRCGAMCHYLLPSRGARRTRELDGRFGDEAYLLFLRAAVGANADPGEFEIKIFGGGNMFPTIDKGGKLAIGEQNVNAGMGLLALHGQQVKASHVGGDGHRIVMFDLWSGDVWVKHQAG